METFVEDSSKGETWKKLLRKFLEKFVAEIVRKFIEEFRK